MAKVSKRTRLFEQLYVSGRKRCRYCPEALLSVLTLEHLTPLTRGGTWHIRNLCVTCYRCNTCKGKMTDAEFKNHLKQIGGPGNLPALVVQTAAYTQCRAKQIRASNGRFRAFDTLAAAQLERATR